MNGNTFYRYRIEHDVYHATLVTGFTLLILLLHATDPFSRQAEGIESVSDSVPLSLAKYNRTRSCSFLLIDYDQRETQAHVDEGNANRSRIMIGKYENVRAILISVYHCKIFRLSLHLASCKEMQNERSRFVYS
jgi:hypothetical protein